MKKFRKILVACAAITTVTLALAASAFADVFTADYVDGKVVITSDAGIPTDGSQVTVIVIPADAEELTSDGGANITADEILYIDQDEGATGVFASMGVKGGTLADGDYIVKIGGTNIGTGILVANFTIGSEEPTYVLGDATGDGSVGADDAGAVLNHVVKITLLDGINLLAADANKDGSVGADDASAILNHVVKITLLGS